MKALKKSLDEVITTKTKIEEINSSITRQWLKLLIPMLIITVVMITSYFDRVAFLKDIDIKEEFVCKSIIKDSMAITIDKLDGWKIRDGYFVKGSDRINIERCRPYKEGDDDE